jgi:hypothetical protein
MSDRHSTGLVFTYKNIIFIHTGDTGFNKDIGDKYEEIKKYVEEENKSIALKENKKKVVLLANIGGFEEYEQYYGLANFNDGKAFYRNHLGRLGIARLVEILEPKLCIVSEFGEEFKGHRANLCDIYETTFEKTIKTKFFPADIGFRMVFGEGIKIFAECKGDDRVKEYVEYACVEYEEVDSDIKYKYFGK